MCSDTLLKNLDALIIVVKILEKRGGYKRHFTHLFVLL